MMSGKMATPGLLKERYFEINVVTFIYSAMTSPKKNFHMTQIILWMWSPDQSLVTLSFV